MTTIDQLNDSTLEKFHSIVERLNAIRNEKIWTHFKLRDAEFLLNEIKDNCDSVFLPIVRFHELEIQCLRWALCPIDLLILEVEANSRELFKTLHQISKKFSRVPPVTKAGKVFAIEYRLMEAEVLMICAAIDFQKRNFIKASHTMVKSNDIFLDLAQGINELRGKTNEALKTDGFISLCQKHVRGKDSVPEELLQNLRKLIDEKTADIRRRHNDRHSAVPEEILEATRSLLQLKQLYTDLSSKWISSDGHNEVSLQSNYEQSNIASSPRRAKSITSLGESAEQSSNVRPPSILRSPDSDDDVIVQDEEEENINDDDAEYNDENSNELQNLWSSSYSPYSSSKTPFSQKLQQKYNISPFKQMFSSKSPVKHLQTRCLEAKFAIESPQKISVNNVTSILPRMFSFSKFLPGYNQQQINSLKQIQQRKSSCNERNASIKNTSVKVGSSQRRRSVYENYRNTTYDVDKSEYLDIEIDVIDFQGLFALSGEDFQEQQLVKAMSRVHFAIALCNLLFANSPKHLKWMLSILKLIPNVTQSIVTLYQIHNFEDSRWGPIATLILSNMPSSVLDNAMKECGNNHVHQYLPINSWDQLHSLIEAQSMLAPWTSKNPLWLSTVARSTSAKICTNSMTRLDFYRRSLASEEDTFTLGSPFGYFSITSMVSKHFLSLGHWTKSYNTSRILYLNPMVRKNMQLESLGVQVAAAAAASCCELFGSQNKYLHLKVSDKIILNCGAASLVEVTMNDDAVLSSSASYRFRNTGNMGNNQHFQLGISQFLFAFYEGGMALTLDEFGYSSAVSSSGDHASTPSKAMEKQAENNLRGRLLHYNQILNISETVDPWKNDSEAMLRATGFWLWLLPVEFLYLMSMKESFTHDAFHNQMLQLCDKGAVLFADRYLSTHLAAAVSDNSFSGKLNNAATDISNRRILGPLIKSIIVDNMADVNLAMARRSLLLIKKVNIVQENILFSGQSYLRLELDERTGIIVNSPLENLIVAMQPHSQASSSTSALAGRANMFSSLSSELKHVETHIALRCVKKIQVRLEKIKQKLECGEETAGQYLLSMPNSAEKVYGDIVVTWLLCRGLILKKLNRIWEAVLMFKLIEVCKDMAPRSKFAVFSAYTELAEIILDYEVCEEPLILAAEYLKRGCVAMRRMFETGYLPYVHEYRRKMKILADRLELLH